MPLVKPHPDVADLADRAFRAGVGIQALLERAKVSRSTWSRWVHGNGHVSSTLVRLDQELTAMIEENDGKGLNGLEGPHGIAGS